jgi:uncharacterized protein
MKGSTSNPMGMLTGLSAGKSQARQGFGGPGRQPVLLENLAMRIARDGSWHYQGSPIGRLPLVKLFASALRQENDGEYWLVTPAERGRVEVEDVPFTAVALRVEGSGRGQRLIFRSNLDDEVTAGDDHPLRFAPGPRRRPTDGDTEESGEAIPYILIRDRLEARVLRPVFYQMVEAGEEHGEQFGVWSSGRFFPLGRLDPAG